MDALRALSAHLSTAFIVPISLGMLCLSSLNSKMFSYFFPDQVNIEYGIVRLPCVYGLSVVFVAIEDQTLSVVIQ